LGGILLVLWDIDGTLLSSEGTGAKGIEIAGRDLFGVEFSLDAVELGGSLDPLILREALALMGLDDFDAHHAIYRSRYCDILKEILEGDHAVRALDGAIELLDRLAEVHGVTQALVTGNYQETAELKLKAAGIDPERFAFGVYGDEGKIRHELPPLALTRYEAHHGAAADHVVLLVLAATTRLDCSMLALTLCLTICRRLMQCSHGYCRTYQSLKYEFGRSGQTDH
jgi:phosphoglycolate phosphatase-like HAD superfamily hydrolase